VTESICFGREPDLPRERRNGHAGGATVAHNTLSADATHVQVFYPFIRSTAIGFESFVDPSAVTVQSRCSIQ